METGELDVPQDVLIEVNVSGEETKGDFLLRIFAVSSTNCRVFVESASRAYDYGSPWG